jgi:DNA invertase Pin-like site-specific DNA recombinase
MTYGYIRVSTDKQNYENQKFEILNYATKNEYIVDSWIEETISSTKDINKREITPLIKKMNKGDLLICSELSRIGRNLMQIMGILSNCMERGLQVHTIKDNYRLGNDIQSQVLAFAFGLSAQIERQLISQRTKEALARRKAEGQILGRPKGSKSSQKKLTGRDFEIEELLRRGVPASVIGRILGVHRLTVASFVNDSPALVKAKLNKVNTGLSKYGRLEIIQKHQIIRENITLNHSRKYETSLFGLLPGTKFFPYDEYEINEVYEIVSQGDEYVKVKNPDGRNIYLKTDTRISLNI